MFGNSFPDQPPINCWIHPCTLSLDRPSIHNALPPIEILPWSGSQTHWSIPNENHEINLFIPKEKLQKSMVYTNDIIKFSRLDARSSRLSVSMHWITTPYNFMLCLLDSFDMLWKIFVNL